MRRPPWATTPYKASRVSLILAWGVNFAEAAGSTHSYTCQSFIVARMAGMALLATLLHLVCPPVRTNVWPTGGTTSPPPGPPEVSWPSVGSNDRDQFMIKESKICPEGDNNKGLFVISNPVLTGTLFEVTMDIVTFPR